MKGENERYNAPIRDRANIARQVAMKARNDVTS